MTRLCQIGVTPGKTPDRRRGLQMLRDWARKTAIPGYLFVPSVLALAAFVLLMLTAGNYGIFTDELYFYACALHPGFGYVDQPPFIGWITAFSLIFGKSLQVLRLFPALAGSATVIVTAAIAHELGGSRFASALASLSILCGTVFWVMFGYVSMNAYDILFVTLAAYLFVRVLRDGSMGLWMVLGVIVGFGLNTKLSMLVFALGLFTGLLSTSRRNLFRTRYPYIAAAIALAMFLPHLIWQASHGWPTLEFIRLARQKNLDLSAPVMIGQLAFSTNPLLVPVWAAGFLGLFRRNVSLPSRSLGVAVAVFFAAYLLNPSKFYYLLPVVPLLLAAGAVLLEVWALERRRWIRTAAVVPVVFVGLVTLPFAVPILPMDSFASYARMWKIGNSMQTERNESTLVPGYFGQRIGWSELAKKVAAVYHSLPDSERGECGILGFHYGDSGCIDYFGPELGLPRAIGRHESYWLWGPGRYTGSTMIVIASGNPHVERYFRSVDLRAKYVFPYIDGPNRTKWIYLCHDPVRPLPQLWQRLKTYM